MTQQAGGAMPTEAITRRRMLATGLTTTAALALGRFAASAEIASSATTHTQTFYDPRFDRSKRLAAALPGAAKLHAISGDASQLLPHLESDFTAARALRLQGVTTESIPFCLEQLTRSHGADAPLQSRRLDRDLFAWTLTLRSGA